MTDTTQKASEDANLPSSDQVSAFINKQRAILIKNLEHQRKSLITLINGRETELKVLSTMTIAKGLLGNEQGLEAEIRILRRRLQMVQSKEQELMKYQAEAGAKAVAKERKLSKNFSRKIEVKMDAEQETTWI